MKHVILGVVAGILVVGALAISGVPIRSVKLLNAVPEKETAVKAESGSQDAAAVAMKDIGGAVSEPDSFAVAGGSEAYLIARKLSPVPGNYEKSDQPTHPYHVEINLPGNRLRLYENDKVKKVFPVCVGHPAHPTPVRGHMSIKSIIWNPSWGPPPDSAWASKSSARAPGKMNPMGVVKMPIKGMIFVHGTYKIKSLGFAWSHGCIRMANEDAVELAWFLQKTIGSNRPNDTVKDYSGSRASKIVYLNQPVPAKTVYRTVEVIDGKLLIHPDIYRKHVTTERKVLEVIEQAGIDKNKINMSRVRRMMARSRTETALMPIEDLMTSPPKSASSGNYGEGG